MNDGWGCGVRTTRACVSRERERERERIIMMGGEWNCLIEEVVLCVCV